MTTLCAEHGISVTGVTKATCGMPQVARAMLDGGVNAIGESRLENIHRLRAGGILAPIVLLRIPPLSGAGEIVASVDRSLNSEVSVVQSLARAAENLGRLHEVILMVDLGDLREGLWPDDLLPAARGIAELPGVRIAGIGTNLSCYGGIMPTEKNMRALVDHAHRVEDALGFKLDLISGGNSSSLPLVAAGKMPSEVNHLRIGEAILLGRETIERRPWPGTMQDAFVVAAEIIELKRKPSVPIGESGQDAFGGKPRFTDRGERLRAILNIGREDVDVSGLEPLTPGVTIVGASSDHLILDAGPAADETGALRLGDEVRFTPSYSALLAAMTSGYVEKRPVGREQFSRHSTGLLAVGRSPILEDIERWPGLRALGYTAAKAELGATGPADTWEKALSPEILPVIAAAQRLTAPAYGALARRVAAREHGPLGMLWISPRPDLPAELLASELASESTSQRPAGNQPAREKPGAGLAGRESPLLEPPSLRSPTGEASAESRVSAENLVFLCLQDAGPTEQAMIRRLRIEAYTMEDVDLLGVREVVRRAMRTAAAGTRGLYVRFDPRCADNGRDGLTNREVHLALELIALSGLLRAFDLSGYTPSGTREIKRLQHFILSVLGKRILSR